MSSIDQGVFSYCRVGIGFPEFFPPTHRAPGVSLMYIGGGIASLTGHQVNHSVSMFGV